MASKSSPSEASQQRNCVAIGDVESVTHESIIAGRDVNHITRIVQQTGGQFPQSCNLPAQLAALQQALPHLTHPAEKAISQATIERLEGAKTVARKTVGVGRTVNPTAEKLELLVKKFGVAALWAAAAIAMRPVTAACVEKFGAAALWAAKLVATRVRLECEWSGESVGGFSGRYCQGSARLRSQKESL